MPASLELAIHARFVEFFEALVQFEKIGEHICVCFFALTM
jgi:hypothetical protein